jgi:hypothetical protein
VKLIRQRQKHRKHDDKTPSSTPEEKEIASPDHMKQQQYQRNPIDEQEINRSPSTVPNKIDFERYIDDIVTIIVDYNII